MESFLKSIKEIVNFLTEKHVLKGNQNIQHKELKALINNMLEINNSGNFESWEALMSPLFDIVEEYEKVLGTKIKEMQKEGKKISEIAGLLSLQPKDVYEYMKKI